MNTQKKDTLAPSINEPLITGTYRRADGSTKPFKLSLGGIKGARFSFSVLGGHVIDALRQMEDIHHLDIISINISAHETPTASHE